LPETPRANDLYEFAEMLGAGHYGQVWSAKHKQTGDMVAVKRIVIEALGNVTDVDVFEDELKVFRLLSHPYIVKLREVFRAQDQLHMIMDLCTGGNLKEYLLAYWQHPDRVSWTDEVVAKGGALGIPSLETGQFMWQMLVGIAYMHHHRFAHRDVKLENYMLVDKQDKSIKLGDFGFATKYRKGKKLTQRCGTALYIAPEVLTESYDEKCDIWGIGVSCFLLVTGQCPWKTDKSEEVLDCVEQDIKNDILDRITRDFPAELKRLVQVMMTRDPESRPSAKSVLKSSTWLKQCGRGGNRCCCVLS